MKKVELLAPAGSMEALIAAVQNGCDAVYLGGEMFGARAYAHNFDKVAMQQAIAYAHGYGVKIYVTMNTLIFEDEIKQAITYAQFLYENNVDAIIVQDLGLFDVLHQKFPSLELHASTQLHIHNETAIQKFHELGFQRVVVPRETTLEEIQRYAKLNVELEVFVQGAMCVSYSGQCLMSSKKLQRSGNRGACAQMCRMKYQLVKKQQDGYLPIAHDGEYLLSMKDLQTLNQVPQLIQAGIASFKIEGRMKRPAYVAIMVACYRKAIDAYYKRQSVDIEACVLEMKKIFNRDFTTGHLFHSKGSSLINTYRPNHMGVLVGKVVDVKKNRVQVILSGSIHQHDGIRFVSQKEDVGCMINRMYDINNRLISSAKANDIIFIETSQSVKKGSSLLQTSDYQQLKAMQENDQKIKRLVPIYMHALLQNNQPMQLSVWDEEGFYVCKHSENKVLLAEKTALSKERVCKQLQKTKDTIFEVISCEAEVEDDIHFPIASMNQLRRDALNELLQIRQQRKKEKLYGTYHRDLQIYQQMDPIISVATIQQAKVAHECTSSTIFIQDIKLFEEYKNNYSWLGYHGLRIMKKAYPNTEIICSENSGIFMQDNIVDHFVNVTNSYAAAFCYAQGSKAIIVSSECRDDQMQLLLSNFKKRYNCSGNFYEFAYGKEELMIMEYCPINMILLNNDKKQCNLCKNNQYYLKDVQNNYYPLVQDGECRMKILDYEITHKKQLVLSPYLCFYEESEEEVIEKIKLYQNRG